MYCCGSGFVKFFREKIELNYLIFSIPNYVIKELYRVFFIDYIKNEKHLEFDTVDVDKAIFELSQKNNIRPFLDMSSI